MTKIEILTILGYLCESMGNGIVAKREDIETINYLRGYCDALYQAIELVKKGDIK